MNGGTAARGFIHPRRARNARDRSQMGERARSISRATLLYAWAVMAGVTRPEVPIMIKRVGEPTLALRSFIHKFNSHRERERVSFGGSRVTPRCSMRRVVPPLSYRSVQDRPRSNSLLRKRGNGKQGRGRDS